jgi:hypothetical protein
MSCATFLGELPQYRHSTVERFNSQPGLCASNAEIHTAAHRCGAAYAVRFVRQRGEGGWSTLVPPWQRLQQCRFNLRVQSSHRS